MGVPTTCRSLPGFPGENLRRYPAIADAKQAAGSFAFPVISVIIICQSIPFNIGPKPSYYLKNGRIYHGRQESEEQREEKEETGGQEESAKGTYCFFRN
jgi:hypothetical protein